MEVIEFEAPDPRFAGEMRMTTSFADADGGTQVTIVCDDIPPGIRPEDNEEGCRQSLAHLARFVEGGMIRGAGGMMRPVRAGPGRQ